MRKSKRLGQHFLIDERVADRQIGYADLRGDDVVLEIGPGLGVLTRRLASVARRVVAVEIDRRLLESLREALPENVDLVAGDATKVELPSFDKVVSNLPYGISTDITFRLLGLRFERAILMYQLEFAERMSARPATDSYGRLSVSVQTRADCRVLERVPPSAFDPPPKVGSAIVRLSPREKPPFPILDDRVFDEVVRAGFSGRRKKLRNAIVNHWQAFTTDRDRVVAAVRDLPFMDERAEVLSPREFGELSNRLAEAVR
ncbi:MAG: 16S rRNA (adenine(1518)-N(6)/adenine(1519)-N(6))-dimethyltransferase RsmA [Methanobacteriota archaeon]